MLTSQVDQVFYVEDGRNPNWVCTVRTKPRNVYDVGQGEGSNDVVQILILASARIVCNIVYVQVRDRIHRELRCKN
jgi:hypothetical protein